MPEEVNGYELFQLCLGKDPGESITVAEYENDLGEDGHSVSVLYGADTGHRRWKLNLPTLAGSTSAANVTVGGVTMTPEAYLWDLFMRTKRSGTPFVIQSPRNDQYYLATFADKTLEYSRMLTKLFSTGLELKQKRIPGITVFDVGQMNGLLGWYKDAQNVPGPFGIAWADASNQINHFLAYNGVVAGVDDVQNGLPVVRFTSASEDAILFGPSGVLKEAFLIMKVRESTFSTFAGILSADETWVALVGDDGGTKFNDLAFGDQYTYQKNGIEYAEANQQAPMDKFALVHARWKVGIELENMQLGKDRAATDRYADIDIGEIVLFDELQPLSTSLELAEHLQDKWDI